MMCLEQNQITSNKPFYVIDKKKELKRKGICTFGILRIEQVGAGLWKILSDSGNIYFISHVDCGLVCDCPYGQKQIGPCRHVRAVEQKMERE
jgi:hypothetical protein